MTIPIQKDKSGKKGKTGKTRINIFMAFWLGLGGFSASVSHADIVPFFVTNRALSFSQILFIQGNCTMSHVNGAFSNVNPAVMCGWAGNGTPGRYVVIANPGRQIRIRILQRDNQGDGFIFLPEGELISDTETLQITAGIAQDIDSGVSGVVNIHLGGRLFVVSPTTPSTSFNLILVDGIEWEELPVIP